LQERKKRKKNATRLQVALFGNLLPTLEIYQQLGFEIQAISESFEKKL